MTTNHIALRLSFLMHVASDLHDESHTEAFYYFMTGALSAGCPWDVTFKTLEDCLFEMWDEQLEGSEK